MGRFRRHSLKVFGLLLLSVPVFASAFGQAPSSNTNGPATQLDPPVNQFRISAPIQAPPNAVRPAETAPAQEPAQVVPVPSVANPGQTVTPHVQSPTGGPTAEAELPSRRLAVEQKLKAVQDATDLTEPIKNELIRRFQKTLDWLKSADESNHKTQQFENEIKQAPAIIEEAKATLKLALPEVTFAAPPDATLAQFEQRLNELETAFSAERDQLAKREDEFKRRTERTAELTRLLAETKQQWEEAQKQLATPATDSDRALAEAKRGESEAHVLALQRRHGLLQSELRRHEVMAEALPLQRDLAKRTLAHRGREVALWQKAVGDRRKLESDRQAREARRQVENAHPALLSLAERNAELAEQRQTLSASIERVTLDMNQLTEQATSLKSEFATTTEKVNRARHSTTIGLLLRKMRDDLPDQQLCEQRRRFIQQETPRVHLRLLELQEERAPLSDVDAAAQDIVKQLDASILQYDPDYVQRMVVDLLQSKRELLDRLINDHDFQLRSLSEIEIINDSLDDRTRLFAEYINEHVLWIRSTEPLGLADLRSCLGAIGMLSNPQNWLGVVRQLGTDALRQPIYAGIIVLILLVLFSFQKRLTERRKIICEEGTKSGTLHFMPTLEGTLIALLLSAQWPALLYYVGWRLSASGVPDSTAWEFCRAVGTGLLASATLLWAGNLIRRLIRPQGIAETHFDWSAVALRQIRGHLGWLLLLGIPTTFVTVFAGTYLHGKWGDSLGRMAFLISMGCLATFCYRVFYPNGQLFRELRAATDDSWLNRFRHVVFLLAVGAPVILSGMAIVGYYYSAQQLGARIQSTVAVMLCLAFVQGLASRWFLVKRRNLAIQQARQKRSESQELATNGAQAAPVVDRVRDLARIHGELRYLLRYAVTAAVFLAGWIIWHDVLPALKAFDSVVVWNSQIQVTQTIEDADGDFVTSTEERMVPTTLRHAMLALILVIVTFSVGKNVPALLEITVLDRLPIDNGGRHAVSIIVHYLTTLVGVMLACRSMNVTWGSVQWLAAAMTVGLGFGLQEIFANLVSGLIILFERPVRVGDIVTVGSVTGTVSRMRMRATTVTDFDRRELIVPNKKFITDDVINWTLSDSISRVVLPVGIAYGSDTALAHALLLRVAREHPLVLDEPEPSALFKGFGESTLDFELRVFIPRRDVFSIVVHELNTAIDQAFRQANIEIAFPQRDLNIRSIQQLLPIATAKSERQTNAA